MDVQAIVINSFSHFFLHTPVQPAEEIQHTRVGLVQVEAKGEANQARVWVSSQPLLRLRHKLAPTRSRRSTVIILTMCKSHIFYICLAADAAVEF